MKKLVIEGVIGRGHDAQVDLIEIRETHVTISLSHILLERLDSATGILHVWSCRGAIILEQPANLTSNWHQMNLWVLQAMVRVDGLEQPLEILLREQNNVDLEVTWTNGAIFEVHGARCARMNLELVERMEAFSAIEPTP
jgi:hypothetical protein